ncbi:MAG TPA: hypothetical protein PLD05_14385 [Thermogutta sp.]|nr:hypothetical protein [Thermogutta sp.]
MSESTNFSASKQIGYDAYPELIQLCLDLTHGIRMLRFWLYPSCNVGEQSRRERLTHLVEAIRQKLELAQSRYEPAAVEPRKIVVGRRHFRDPIEAVLRLAQYALWSLPDFQDFRFNEVPEDRRNKVLNLVTPDYDSIDRLECELRCVRFHPQQEKQPLVLTALQKEILKALDRRALKKEDLADRLKIDPARLYRPGGIKELIAQALVAHKWMVGYYRPDRPPAECGD